MQTPQTHDATPDRSTAPFPPGPEHALDDLLDLGADELLALSRAARVPRLDSIRGDLRGRMLRVTALPDAVAPALRTLARSNAFPWRGKSFAPRDANRGDGINRVITDRNKWFRF